MRKGYPCCQRMVKRNQGLEHAEEILLISRAGSLPNENRNSCQGASDHYGLIQSPNQITYHFCRVNVKTCTYEA